MRGEIYAAGEHIATYENDLTTPTTFFTHSDHLGTERVQTAVNGSSCETITNTAFGDGMNETGSCDPTALRFTDKLRDYETNLDDFGARFYSSQLGRFMSADWSAVPAPVPYANLNNPQTLNLYAIVADNPETFADLDGHCQDGDTAQSACATPFGANAGAFGEPAPNVAPDQKTGTDTGPSPSQDAAQHAAQQQKRSWWQRISSGFGSLVAAAVKTYQTYTKTNPESGKTYSGRTSGTGTPEQNVEARDQNHHMNEEGYSPAQLDKSSSSPEAIRGREQQLIEASGGAQSQGGTSGNAINGISPRNPNAQTYRDAASSEWGTSAEEWFQGMELHGLPPCPGCERPH